MSGRSNWSKKQPKGNQVAGRMDPVWFATKVLGLDPWEKQVDILNALRDHDFVAVRSCNGSGKTFTAALAAIWWLLAHDEAVVITTAPSERQVKELLWREIRGIHSMNRHIVGGKLSSTRLELSERRFAFGFSTNSADRFQGFHNKNILAIVDEASGVREFIFDAIFGCLTSENAKMLMVGNPMSLAGTFYDAFHKNREYWKTIHISAFDTPAFKGVGSRLRGNDVEDGRGNDEADGRGNGKEDESGSSDGIGRLDDDASDGDSARAVLLRSLERQKGVRGDAADDVSSPAPSRLMRPDARLRPVPGVKKTTGVEVLPYRGYPAGITTPKWVESIANQRGKNSSTYQIRVLGEFPEDAEDTLIALRLIESAVGRESVDSGVQDVVMGLDVARYGGDETVAIVRRGSEVVDIAVFGQSDLMHTTGRMIDMARDHGVSTIYVDEVGLGAGVVDRAKEIGGVRVTGVNGGSKASDSKRYVNLRAEMFDGLRKRFADGEIGIPDDSELISQLASLTYRYTSRGQLQLENKDQIRQSGRQSPDKADALALAFMSDPNPLRIWYLGPHGLVDSNTYKPPRRRRRMRDYDDWW